MSDDKRPTTVRLKESQRVQLEAAAAFLDRSQTSILAEGLELFLEKHPELARRYQLSVSQDHTVLLEIEHGDCRIKEVKTRNGVSTDRLAAEYRERRFFPLQVVEEK